MASKTQAQRYIHFIHQQIQILKGERKTVLEALDDAINQVQSEVDAWVNGRLVNQTTFVQMNNRITQFIAFFMTVSVEMSENESNLYQTTLATSNDSTIPKTSYTMEEAKESPMIGRQETLNESDTGVDTSYITTTRFAILEEAVLSLKTTTEQVQEKQENVNKKLEILTNANLKSKKKVQERLTVLEKKSKEISSNFDELFETAKVVNGKLKTFEDENNYINEAMNELNKKISSIEACSNDALMYGQELSKGVESTNQQYNEMSNKMDQLEISINLISSQYTEQLETMISLNENKNDDVIGMGCQLPSKRLAPLETLNETINTKFTLSEEHISKIEAIDSQLVEISGKVAQIESKFNQPTLLFNAYKTLYGLGRCNIDKFPNVPTNYGSHFDSSSGIFTAPVNGFYLISIHVITRVPESFSVKCFQKLKNMPVMYGNSRQLCCVTDDECVTCLVELKKDEMLWLQLKTKEIGPIGLIRIQFSCFMIKR